MGLRNPNANFNLEDLDIGGFGQRNAPPADNFLQTNQGSEPFSFGTFGANRAAPALNEVFRKKGFNQFSGDARLNNEKAAADAAYSRMASGRGTQADADLLGSLGIPVVREQTGFALSGNQTSASVEQFGDQRFNRAVNINREGATDQVENSLAEIIRNRQEIARKSQDTFNNNVANVFADFVEKDLQNEVTSGVQPNAFGRVQLIQRLRRQFGPAFANVPAARKILAQFDDVMGQNQDITGIQKMMDQGRTALSFLEALPESQQVRHKLA